MDFLLERVICVTTSCFMITYCQVKYVRDLSTIDSHTQVLRRSMKPGFEQLKYWQPAYVLHFR